MTPRAAASRSLFLALCALVAGGVAAAATRIEAKSAHYFAVGVVDGERMIIHLSELADNAPVHDASVRVVLRGSSVAAVAQPDGSYAVQTPALSAPGEARMDFVVMRNGSNESLSTTLREGAKTEGPTGNTRQLGWWVLNFAVCIGFLWLFSRRKKVHVE